MKKSLFGALALSVMAAPAFAGGGTVVAPNSMAAAPGNGGLNTITRNAGNPRTYQLLIDDSQLAAIPANSNITGFTFRMFGTFAPWPPSGGANWTDYNIWMSTPLTGVTTMSTTFANNVGANVTQVYDGPLNLAQGSFPLGGGAGGTNAFGPIITLTAPFLYPGGDLLLEFRHPGGTHTDSNGFVDSVTVTHAENGTNIRALSATGDTATVGAFTSANILQLQWEPIPAPGALALLGLAGLATTRRRRSA